MLNTLQIGFIGGGNMASAILGGLLERGALATHITVVDPYAGTREQCASRFGVRALEAPDDSLKTCDVLVLAVKPQQFREMITQLKPFVSQQLLFSVAAGIRMQDMSRWLDGYTRIVRAMPNTPALIGKGMTGLAALPQVTESERATITQIAAATGQTLWVKDESLIDPITAISGSGPAYVFYFIEAMQQAAEELGLSAQQGRELAVATFIGAAELAGRSDEPVSLLRERVTSKGGTTYAALTTMEDAGMKAAFVKALHAAAARGKEMGQEFGKD